jgi:pheromone shutdown-related protein TraB
MDEITPTDDYHHGLIHGTLPFKCRNLQSIMSQSPFPTYNDYPSDVHIVSLPERTILLVGTAHISQESVDLVRDVIIREKPDRVCIELDDNRYQALSQKDRWQSLDLKEILKKKQLSTLLVSLLMASYQKKLGGQLGVTPGTELLAAAQTAEAQCIPFLLCDRDVRITLRRAWKSTSFFKKGYLLALLLATLFDTTEIEAKKLVELKKKDVLSELLAEMGKILPAVKEVLIDERDIFLAEKIKTSAGRRIVAIVGAGHVEGIKRRIVEDNQQMLAELSAIPPVSKGWKIAGWGIPVLIIGSIFTIGLQKGASVAGASMVFWFLAHALPAAAGALIALAHPYTTLGAFAAAPFTSLTPIIRTGYVTAFIQVMTKPPIVQEFETVGNDISTMNGWWKNKLLRVFLVFFLTGIGSAIGTWVSGYQIFKNLVG